MIKRIYLHVGVHKTATTSIQESFGEGSKILASNGYLYPIFSRNNDIIVNHSEVFYSLFCEKPESYHMNIKKGFTSRKLINELHQSYRDQLVKQLEKFNGEYLILSGEDMSLLGLKELQKLRHYLLEITNPKVHIEVILFCRNPAVREKAHILQLVKGGYTLEQAFERNDALPRPFYQIKINHLSEVFSCGAVHVIRFEDAILHKEGPGGALLSGVGAGECISKQLGKRFSNQSLSYEATILTNAINTNYPRYIKNQLFPSPVIYCQQSITLMPGQKYILSLAQSQKIWNRDKKDMDWLCKTFHLPAYEFTYEKPPNDADKWSEDVLINLKTILSIQPAAIKEVILKELIKELKKYRSVFSLKKKTMIFSCLMHNSFYLQLNSRGAKFIFFQKQLGFFLALKLSLIYIKNNLIDHSTMH